MRRAILLLASLSILISCFSVKAELVTRSEALLVAERWLQHRQDLGEDWGQFGSVRVEACRELVRDGRLLGYWLPVEPQGHIIVSPLKEMPAIKAFSAVSNFDPEQAGYPVLIHDVLAATLDFLEQAYGSLENLPAGVGPPSHLESWRRLLAGGPYPRDRDTVGPLLQSDWWQADPFKDNCPMGDGNRCVVGCVALAASQILNYWKYPEHGEGVHSYYWDGDDSCGGDTEGQQLTAYFEDSYDWADILDSYHGDYNATQAAAVAELCFEVGVGINNDFGACGSGSSQAVLMAFLPEHMRFASELGIIVRGDHDADGWWEQIRGELSALPPRPLHYAILKHSLVCDGYREEGDRYYHMNYGWGPGSSAWYALDDLYCPWEECDLLVESAITGIEPAGHFTVPVPGDGEIWTHGDPIGAIHWLDSLADSVVIDLYRGRDFIARLSDWTENDGDETPAGTVDPAWGTGSLFRIKVVGDDMQFGWTMEFGIYSGSLWTDAGAAPLNDAGRGRGVAWGDCDGDGLVDLYISNRNDGNRLFGNEGAGVFTDLTTAPLDDTGYCTSVAWADMDNDGDLDLFLGRAADEPNSLFRNDGNGGFTDIGAGPFTESSYTLGAAWGDYDNDGLVDLYLAKVYQADALLHNEGGGIFTNATAFPLGNIGWGRAATWVDYDDDGNLDLYLVKFGRNKLYRNLGSGIFEDATLLSSLADGGSGYAAAWGDFDNDGDLDVYLVNDGANKLFRNDDNGEVFVDVTSGELGNSGDTRCAAWGDYDNDGWLDLYIVGHGGNQLLRNDGTGQFSDTTDPLLGDIHDGEGAAWADYDNDGDLDLYLVNNGQANRLFQNDNANGNHWLHVDLAGDMSNRNGIGARLVLFAGELMQTRQVGSEAGYLSQGTLTAEFGLGDATQIDSLVIDWPSGVVSQHFGLAADHRYLIEEESTAVPELPAAADVYALHANHPNPFNPRTEIAFGLPRAAPVELRIYDLSGRRVRTLLANDRVLPAGTHRVTWDGSDEQFRPLPSGVYFCLFKANGFAASRKLILLK